MASTILKRRALDATVCIVVLAAILHFGHRGVQGESGVFTRLAVEKEKRRLETELAAVRTDRARLENLTLRLSDGYLDIDLLDERAREVLGYIRPDEVVIR